MKKLIVMTLTILNVFAAKAQLDLLNGSFEDTLVSGGPGSTGVLPRHWTTSGFGAGITNDAAAGTYAMSAWNWYFYAKGSLINGQFTSNYQAGTPVSFRPDRLSGYYKYIPGDVQTFNDSAVVFVSLTKYNVSTQQRDTIGYGMRKLGPENSYQPFDVAIAYSGIVQPDTIVVQFISSESGFCSGQSLGECLYLFVDEVRVFDSTTGVSDDVRFVSPVVYPNPASDFINVQPGGSGARRVVIYAPAGSVVLTESLNDNGPHRLFIGHLQPGVYFVNVGAGDAFYKLVKQ